MLKLTEITKVYSAGENRVEALRGISLAFRKSEFVAVLGPSGCGKTTLLNIIGGLDHYTGGEMTIQGRPTREYRDRDWDNYRNHRVGFVFQSYNLIPHQTVLANVELALTLSGVSGQERRQRAMEALARVGLKGEENKRPNQLSGGQMQRVAIARALVNRPEILLADEPTGALDTETGIQVMEILGELARDHLVIMVTHNPELADRYASRIIRLKDGRVTGDSDPFEGEEADGSGRQAPSGEKRPSMSFWTALSLSFNNLLTKKGRTLLTSFAGSIGIIGIALILSISTGVRQYIQRVQQDTLSSYPIEIESTQMDMSGMMVAFMSSGGERETAPQEGTVRSGDVMSRMLNAMNTTMTRNDLKAFRAWIEDGRSGLKNLVSDVRYEYGNSLNIYRQAGGEWIRVNPSQVLAKSGLMGSDNAMMGLMSSSAMMSTTFSNLDVFTQLLDNEALLRQQYETVAGRFPAAWNEMVIIVSRRNAISDYTLYALGLRDQNEIRALTEKTLAGEEISVPESVYTYDELLGLSFRLLLPSSLYADGGNGVWRDMSGDAAYLREVLETSPELKIVGIIRPKEDAVATQSGASGGVGYLSSLQEYAARAVEESEAVRAQLDQPEKDIFTGLPFKGSGQALGEDFVLDRSLIPEQFRPFVSGMTDEQILEMARKYGEQYGLSLESASTLGDNLKKLGRVDLEDPDTIYIYPKDFESKNRIADLIAAYNEEAGDGQSITYTDYIGLIMSSVTTIVNAVSYVLIAFVAISLVVSSIMIGIITYISVLERTKEIGILRSLGASKRDVGRVFSAETLIVGFISGVLGILCTLLLNRLVNVILHSLTGISATAVLPLSGAVILVCISMGLTLIAGLIPSGKARRQDPVTALRSE